MNKRLSFNKQESAGLRQRLEGWLSRVFACEKIGEYLVSEQAGNEIQLLTGNATVVDAFPQTKLAYDIWTGMHVGDRHAVLGKFQCLYAALPATYTSRKTLTFCAVFINEFAEILAEAMEWPD